MDFVYAFVAYSAACCQSISTIKSRNAPAPVIMESNTTMPLKNIRKVFSVCFQILVLMGVGFLLARQFMETGEPPEFNREHWAQRDGFVAISYQSLTRTPEEGLNSREQFVEHLQALQDAGYSFVTSDDISDFFHNNKPLPEKAVYIMFEGGRKDSAIFGQKVLSENRGHATFCAFSSTLEGPGMFFANIRQVKSIAESSHWGIGSQGYKLLSLPSSDDKKENRYYLCDYLLDEQGVKAETEEEMFARLAGFYENSYKPLAGLADSRAIPFVFPPANSFFRMPREIEEANRKLMKRYFKIAFTREGSAFNSAGTGPYNLTRMQVDSQLGPQELLGRLKAWSTDINTFSVHGPESAKEWFGYEVTVNAQGRDIVLTPTVNDVAMPAYLRGTDMWRDVALSVELPRDDGERQIYLRHTSKHSYLRLSIKHNRIRIHERLPGSGLLLIHDGVLTGKDPWKLDVLLKGNRLRLVLDGVPMVDGFLPVSPALVSGRLAVSGIGGPGYKAFFRNFTASRIDPLWEDKSLSKTVAGAENRVTGAIIHLPSSSEEVPKTLHTLLQSAATGEQAIASLPAGELRFDPAVLLLEPLEERQAKTLWQGVMLRPGVNCSWDDVDASLQKVREFGFSPVVRLDAEAVRALVASGGSIQADNFLLDFSPGDLDPSIMRGFANKHNRNHFLFLKENGSTKSGLYAVGDK